MSTPEILPEAPRQPETIAERPENPIVPETIQSLGVTPPPTPKPVVTDDNQVIAAPVPAAPVFDPATTLTVPPTIAHSEKDLEKGAHGPENLSVTWLDVLWLRKVKQYLAKGWRVIFG